MKKEKITELKWKKSIDRELRTAVANFNKKVRELQIDGEREYLPEQVDYKVLHQRIKSREELSRVIHDLKRFGKEGQEDVVILQSGEGITKWELNKLKGEQNRALKQVREEIAEYHKPITESGFTRAQMGSTELRKLEAKEKMLLSLETRVGQAFQNLKRRISTLGTLDFKLRKAIIYRQNYYNTIVKQFSNFHGYEELKKAFDEHKDPFEFYEWIKEVSDGNIDIIDIHVESSTTFSQQQFYKFLEDLKIKYDKSKEIIESEDNE